MYYTNDDGKWKVVDGVRVLIEPSETFEEERERRKQERLESELLESLLPSDSDVLKAEIELEMLNLLIDLEVI